MNDVTGESRSCLGYRIAMLSYEDVTDDVYFCILILSGFLAGCLFHYEAALSAMSSIMDITVPFYTVVSLVLVNFLVLRKFWKRRKQRFEESGRGLAYDTRQHCAKHFISTIVTLLLRRRHTGRRDASRELSSVATEKSNAAPARSSVSQRKSSSVGKYSFIADAVSSKVNLSGSYKLEKNINFQEFLASQGVSWALRKAADKASIVNHITHVEDTLRIRVQGIVSSETTYIVNGPPVETRIQSKVFQDTMTYLSSGDGVQVMKVNEESGDVVVVRRKLSKDATTMTIASTALLREGKEVECTQIFHRVPNET